MAYTVTGDRMAKIDFSATGVAEVLQNVRMILTTPVFSVPLDRAFGVDWSLLDSPMPAAQARLIGQVFAAIRQYEPRAVITQIDFIQDTEDALSGRMIPRVTIGEVNL